MPIGALKQLGGPCLLALMLTGTAGPAHADAIDGDWCSQDGKQHFSIRGPDLVTPHGTRMKGSYDRHGFAYTVPAHEPGAGGAVDMTLVDEDTIFLTRKASSGASGNPETWTRCEVVS